MECGLEPIVMEELDLFFGWHSPISQSLASVLILDQAGLGQFCGVDFWKVVLSDPGSEFDEFVK
jgi:hypothetical protein